MAPAPQQVLAGLDGVRSDVEELYRDLHSHPELSHREHRSAEIMAQRLTDAGFDVTTGVGGTGVVGILANGSGPTVVLRADMDALPVREDTDVDYASTVVDDSDGASTPVMHACGHDVHMASLVGATRLLADATDQWSGTLVALFQPAEEVMDGARTMVADGLADVLPRPDVILGQHVLSFPSGQVGTRVGPVLSATDSLKVTIHGRGAHGSMPQAAVDPVVIAGSVIMQLQQVVSRFLAPNEPAVVTVGSVHAGTKGNVIPATAELLVNVRTYTDEGRATVLGSIERIVRAACTAAGAPREPEIEAYERAPLTNNDEATTATVADAFADHFGEQAVELPLQSASEDFSEIPDALGVPYTYWGIGGADPEVYAQAVESGTVNELPVNHSPHFLPVMQPTLDTGVSAMVVAALAYLG